MEGSGEPFIVWTDHKNLEYIRSAKRLNSRQARCLYFSVAFIFLFLTVQVLKTLNRMRCPAFLTNPSARCLPSSSCPRKLCFLQVTWEIESKVRTALQGVTPPPGCPPSRLFVPENLRSDVIRWGHCSKVACHPGVSRTIFLVKQRFWWQSMARDIQLFALACSVCAISKTSNRPPAGLLQPLSVPSRPWSHISLDFVTGLPPSQGNTVVLTVVDRFSKATNLIPLPKIPSARNSCCH